VIVDRPASDSSLSESLWYSESQSRPVDRRDRAELVNFVYNLRSVKIIYTLFSSEIYTTNLPRHLFIWTILWHPDRRIKQWTTNRLHRRIWYGAGLLVFAVETEYRVRLDREAETRRELIGFADRSD